jgi:hypothetical protein
VKLLFVLTMVLVVVCGIHFSCYEYLILTTFVLVEYCVLRLYYIYIKIYNNRTDQGPL